MIRRELLSQLSQNLAYKGNCVTSIKVVRRQKNNKGHCLTSFAVSYKLVKKFVFGKESLVPKCKTLALARLIKLDCFCLRFFCNSLFFNCILNWAKTEPELNECSIQKISHFNNFNKF